MLPDSKPRTWTGAAPTALPSPKGRGKEYVRALEDTARGLRDPVVKLRYLRTCMEGTHRFDRVVRHVPFGLLRRGLYRWLSLELLRLTLTRRATGQGRARVPPSSRRALARARLGVAAAAAVLVGGLSASAWYVGRHANVPVLLADAYAPPPTPEPVDDAAEPPAPTLVPSRGVVPEQIWQVEQGEGYELYSNGLRIDTRYTVAGEPRAYRVFDRRTGAPGEELLERPRGILFHTSESDILPLEEDYNADLRDGTHRLLRYLARNKVYHYLVDRFGRVFRVVDEESKANHAGYSIWAAGDDVYLSLNNAFLALSYETRWEGGLTLPITQAQFAAGRSLSDWLRQRYEIAPELCVAHGLASVNPHKYLIGHHLDWSRGFPFGEYGLPDQYATPVPAVALFGFAWDEHLVEVLGEPWPGVTLAERHLQREALLARKDLWDFRRERQRLYDAWVAEQSRDEARRAEGARSGAKRTEARGSERAPAPGSSGG